MSEVVCQVTNQASQVEFIWSSRGGYFRPYCVSGQQLVELRQAADQTRSSLESLVFALNEAGAGSTPSEPSFELAEAGFRLFNYLLPSEDETAKKVRRWLEDVRKQSGLIGLEVVVEEQSADPKAFLSVPWNLVYDERPSKHKAAFQKGEGAERWRPFWAVRYNLTSGRRVEPLKRLSTWTDPKVVVVVDPAVHQGLNDDQKGRLDGFLAEAGLTAVGSMDELEAVLEEGYPRLLYWLGHATPEYLMLGDERIAPGDLRNLLRSFDDRERPEGMLAFLNACQTAESGSGGSFLDVLHSFGFTGAIATERQTIDTFANEFGLSFLKGFLRDGKPLGELLHGLRLQSAPLGLLYGAHCPPEIRVRLAGDAADAPAPLPIRESGPVSGVALGATATRGRRKTRRDRRAPQKPAGPHPAAVPPLPDEPYRSLAFYDEKDRALFTGRDADVVRFAATLDRPDTRILILHGESGTGKSSFLRAGVIPYLEHECVGYRFLRRHDGLALIVQAAKDLVGGLAQALLDATATSLRYDTPDGEPLVVNLRRVLDEALGAPADYATLREALRRDVHLLANVLARMAGRLPHALVLVLDQAEEVFTLARAPEEVAGRDHALRMLQRLVDVRADVKLIVSLRTEYYGRLQDHLRAGRRDLTGVRDDLLRDFSRSALVEAITRPTSETPLAPGQPSPREKYGLHYAEGIPGQIADGVLAMRSENQDSVLPLVQVICTQLYQREKALPGSDGIITREDLDAIKGVEGGLKAFAEDALERSMRLGPADREAFKALYGQLYNRQPDGTLTTWLMPRASLERQWGRPTPFAAVLETAKAARLLREDELRIEGGEPRRYIRLGHDALAKVAAAWQAEREERERLEQERAKRRKQFRRLLIGSSFFAALALAFGLGGITLYRKNGALKVAQFNAERESRRARRAETESEQRNRELEIASRKAEREASRARDAEVAARHQQDEAKYQGRIARARLARTVFDKVESLKDSMPDHGLELLLDEANIGASDRDFTWGYYYRLLSDRVRVFDCGRMAGFALAYSPNGKTLAVGGYGGVSLFDVAKGELRTKLPLKYEPGAVFSVAFSADGKSLVSGGGYSSSDKFPGELQLWDVTSGSLRATFEGQAGTIWSVALSPDGKTLASASGFAYDEKSPGELRLWDVATAKSRLTLEGHGGSVFSVAFSPDGKTLASGDADNLIRLRDVATGEPRATLRGHGNVVAHLAYSPDGKTLASASNDGTVALWNVAQGTVATVLRGHEGSVYSVAFSPDARSVASASWDATVRLWEVGTGQALATLRGYKSQTRSVAFSPDGRFLATGSWEQTFRVWNLTPRDNPAPLRGLAPQSRVDFGPDGRTLVSGGPDGGVRVWNLRIKDDRAVPPGYEFAIHCATLDPDGKTLATGGVNRHVPAGQPAGEVRLWDLHTGEARAILQGHDGPALCIAYSPDGKTLVSGGQARVGWKKPGVICVWDVGSGTSRAILRDHEAAVTAIAISPDGKILASGAFDGSVRLWDLATGGVIARISDQFGTVLSLAFSPDGKTLAAGGGEPDDLRKPGMIRLWDTSDAEARATLTGYAGAVYSVAFSPDGKMLAATTRNGTLRISDVATGENLVTIEAHSGPVRSVAFHPAGKVLATGGADGDVRLWPAAAGAAGPILAIRHGFPVNSVTFSPDGKTIVAGSPDAVRLWDTKSNKARATFPGHNAGVFVLAYNPDGKILASGDLHGVVRLWDVTTGKVRATLRGHTAPVKALAFSPDGKVLATGGEDGCVRIWDPSTGKEHASFPAKEVVVKFLAFGPGGNTLVASGHSTALRQEGMTLGPQGPYHAVIPRCRILVLDIAAGRARLSIQDDDFLFHSAELLPDGKTLVTAGTEPSRVANLADSRVVRLLDITTGKARASLKIGYIGAVAALSRDGRVLAYGDSGGDVALYDIAEGKARNSFKLDKNSYLNSIAFTPDGRTMVTCHRSQGMDTMTPGELRLWDVETGEARAVLRGHRNEVVYAAFSPDGRTLASIDSDRSLILWKSIIPEVTISTKDREGVARDPEPRK